MFELATRQLWIGNAGDARTPLALHDAGILTVMDVAAEEPPANVPRSMMSLRFPLLDGGDNDPRVVCLALQTAVHLINANVPTLIACSAGMSRSPAVAAAALSIVSGEPADRVLQDIAARKPLELNHQLWADVLKIMPQVLPGSPPP